MKCNSSFEIGVQSIGNTAQHMENYYNVWDIEQITKADLQTVTLFNELHNLKIKNRASQLEGGLVPPFYDQIKGMEIVERYVYLEVVHKSTRTLLEC